MYKNKYPGKFIVIEGLDGSGQTTQAKLLREFLESEGEIVCLTKEPTIISDGTFYSSVAQTIRDVLDKKIQMEARPLQELFTQDRKEHLEKEILPALEKGGWVICDRYCYSSFAFGSAHGNNMDFLISLNEDFLIPDYVFLLKVSPKTCIQRIARRNEGVKFFEVEEKLKKTWLEYEKVLKKFPYIKLINGENSIEEVHKEIKKHL